MKLPPLISLWTILIAASCASETSTKKTISSYEKKADTVVNKFEILSNDSLLSLLNRVKIFAENFTPKSNSGASLSEAPDSIAYSFKQLRIHGNNEYIKYLVLILVKVYRTHLKCCHQGYELRKNAYYMGIDSIADPLLYEFNLISKTYDRAKPIEFVHSGIGQTWLDENKYLLEYDTLKREDKEIEKIGAGILKEPNKYY